MSRVPFFALACLAIGVVLPSAVAEPSESVGVPIVVVRYEEVAVTAGLAGGPVVASPVPVPVPVALANTPRDLAERLDGYGFAPAGEVADAIPEGDIPLPTGGTGTFIGFVALLPDESLVLRAESQGEEDYPVTLILAEDDFRAVGLEPDNVNVVPSLAETVEVATTRLPEFGGAAERLLYGGGGDELPAPLPYAPIAVAPLAAPETGPASAPRVSAAGATATHVPAPASALSAAKAAVAVTAAVAVPALLGWALYHRIKGHSTLDNETRKMVFDFVAARPGAGVADVAQHASVSYSTASYHLERLCDARMLVMSAEAGKLRYYKNGGAFNEEERKVLPLLKNAEAMRVLGSIMEKPGTYRAEIAERLGVTPTTVNWHLKRLADARLLVETRQGRSAYLSVDRARLAALVAPLVPKLEETEAETAAVAKRVIGDARLDAAPAPLAA